MSHATSHTISPIPWYHVSEMQSMNKTVEQHSQDLTWVKSTLCGLQRKISEKLNGLEQRMEALEGAKARASKQNDQEKATHTSWSQHGPLVKRLDTLAVSMTDLEARFELLRSNTAAQLATLSVGLEQQRMELGSKEFLPTDSDLQACIVKASSHVSRLERLIGKWTEMQAVQGSSKEQFREVAGEDVPQCTQTSCHLRSLEPCCSRLNHPPVPAPLYVYHCTPQPSTRALGSTVFKHSTSPLTAT